LGLGFRVHGCNIYIYIYICVCVCVCVCVCIYICVCVCICVYMYIYSTLNPNPNTDGLQRGDQRLPESGFRPALRVPRTRASADLQHAPGVAPDSRPRSHRRAGIFPFCLFSPLFLSFPPLFSSLYWGHHASFNLAPQPL